MNGLAAVLTRPEDSLSMARTQTRPAARGAAAALTAATGVPHLVNLGNGPSARIRVWAMVTLPTFESAAKGASGASDAAGT